MIKNVYLDNLHQQKGGTCVLSSYSIVNNYFTRILVDDIFHDYCKHFNLKGKINLSERYDGHFHEHIRNASISGYQCILDLHNTSIQKSFKTGREIFGAMLYSDTLPYINSIENELKQNDSLLNLTYYQSQINQHHSVTIYFDIDNNKFILRDTGYINKNGKTAESIHDLITDGEIKDSVLYKSKK
jgi:hypothetical protein